MAGMAKTPFQQKTFDRFEARHPESAARLRPHDKSAQNSQGVSGQPSKKKPAAGNTILGATSSQKLG